MLPAAISISTCASSSGARCRAVSGGSSFEGNREGALERVSDGGRGQGYVSLGQTYQRQTGLRIPAGAVCGQQGLLRAFDVPLSKSDPSELAQRSSQLASQVRA